MKERKLFTICLSFIIVLFVVTFFLGGYFPGISGPSEIERSVPDGGSVVAAGRVYRREQKSDYQILYLKNVSVYYQEKSFKESRLIIYDEEKERIGIGNRIVVKGEVSYFDPAGNPGNFDRKFYYQKQKIHVSVWSDTVRVANGGVYPVRNALADIREHWKEVLISYAGEEDGSILCAVILGDKSGMEEEMKELYQKNGIAHILAISGVKTQNLAIPLSRRNRINSAFVPLHIAKIYILKLYLDEEIIPRCRFPCSRGYLIKCINWQKKQ